ncbi:hypothetical protein VAEU17_4290064 [Vibrio aestuarianus]|nr:hypothetical protein VAEU17_4290064 [Vibrio aestuarianus]
MPTKYANYLIYNKSNAVSQKKSLRNRFPSIADKLEMGNMNLVGRILTRNRKAPRIWSSSG